MQTVNGVAVATTKAEQIEATAKVIEACVAKIRGDQSLTLHQRVVLGMALRRLTSGERNSLRSDIVGRPQKPSGNLTDYQWVVWNRCNAEFDKAWAESGRLRRAASDFKGGVFIAPDAAHKVVYDWLVGRLRNV